MKKTSKNMGGYLFIRPDDGQWELINYLIENDGYTIKEQSFLAVQIEKDFGPIGVEK